MAAMTAMAFGQISAAGALVNIIGPDVAGSKVSQTQLLVVPLFRLGKCVQKLC